MRITVDLSAANKLRKDLEKFAKRALPYAARSAVNELAFESRKQWLREIEGSMVLRNRWTAGSIRVEKAKGRTIGTIEARLGSVSPYMLAQEEGRSSQLGGKTAIPTSAAAGQMGARPRTRLVRAPNRMQAISLARRARGASSPKQRNAIAIRQAQAQGRRFAFLQTPKGKGLFKLVGGKRKPKLQMVWALGRSSRVPRNPTLARTVLRAVEMGPAIYHRALLAQLKRHKVLGY